MKLSVLILTYNRKKITEICLPEIINNLDIKNSEILIADNASTDGTLDFVYTLQTALNKNIQIFTRSKNYGMDSINFLVKKAKGQYILKMDSDIIPPKKYASRMLSAYAVCKEDNIAYLSWDIPWGSTTFAKRSGMKLYKPPCGKIINVNKHTRVLLSKQPSKWMVNGACRLSSKKIFKKCGGHPKGKIYGVDHFVSTQAEKFGYTCGFLDTPDKALHVRTVDLENLRDKTSTT